MGHDTHSHSHSGHDHSGHGHSAHAGHSHAPASFGTAFAVGIGLNSLVVIAEVVFGVLGNSIALVADAAHNLSDVLGLAIAFAATRLATRPPSARFTYGLRGTSILAALFNAVFLLVITGGLSWAAIERLMRPEPVAGKTMMLVAAGAMIVNGITAALFAAGRKDDLNIRGAFLHMAADAAISAGVVVGGLVILATGWLWFDPLISLLVNVIIIVGTWSLLRESLALSLDAVPKGIESSDVRRFLGDLPGVTGLHDLHIWAMSTHETALTCHLVIPAGHPGDAFLMQAAAELQVRYKIGHATFQVETDRSTVCALAPDEVL